MDTVLRAGSMEVLAEDSAAHMEESAKLIEDDPFPKGISDVVVGEVFKTALVMTALTVRVFGKQNGV